MRVVAASSANLHLSDKKAPRVLICSQCGHGALITINAGEDGSIVVGKISDNDTYAFGYDAQEGQYGDLVSKGIIDPTKVVRTALQDAASIAGLLVTTEAMVAEKPKKETPPMPGMPPGGGMDY
jgi:chaperonin GroEL